MSDWHWNGARWWKFDFHAHTPASEDYGKGPDQARLKARTPREWLLDHMRAGIDCVAVTDHNSGAWIDPLKSALEELRSDQPEGFRDLHLFPGVEISVHGGIHLLAILDPERTTSDIDSLLGAVKFKGTKGSASEVTQASFPEVVREVEALGGIPVPAHVDGPNGLLQVDPAQPGSSCVAGGTLKQALERSEIFAMEVHALASPKPQLYNEKKHHWTEVLGSDSHHPCGDAGQRYPGSHFTWVKMGPPGLEGFRLALLDGELSVRRSDQESADPNRHPPLVLESIEVTAARYMGRAVPFTLKFNPWLNTIIGGRGTGKSTLVEFLRLALRRVDELPEALRPELDKYAAIYANRGETGLLTEQAQIRVVYRKNGSRFRIQWSPTAALDPIEEWEAGEWRHAEGEIAQRFPIRIYSQKQVFQLATTPLALLRVVDEAPEVDRHGWNSRWKQEEARLRSLRARSREIEASLEEKPRLQGELDDARKKLAIFEAAEHSEILRRFQRRTRQQRAVETWEESWAETGNALRTIASTIVPADLDENIFDRDAEEDRELRELTVTARASLESIRAKLDGLASDADAALAQWWTEKGVSRWKAAVDAAGQDYLELRRKLAAEGAGDPTAYGELVQRRQTIERRLANLVDREKQVEDLRQEAQASLERLLVIRRELTEVRRRFLATVLQENPYVAIKVVYFGTRENAETELRRLLLLQEQREDRRFAKDIEGLLGKVYDLIDEEQPPRPAGLPSGGDLTGPLDRTRDGDETTHAARKDQALAEIKQRIRGIAEGKCDPRTLADQRFAAHLRKLSPEAIDRIDLWFPEDFLVVEYSPSGDGRGFRPIDQGSPGQKTAALLAFLLSYGEEPLVLDQPEEDLDNLLIYGLIVAQLRQRKQSRQIVVVTHNPNIVVNGDAELVVALTAKSGESRMECNGSLQEKKVRDTVCAVMEGGREAFEKRSRRYNLETGRV